IRRPDDVCPRGLRAGSTLEQPDERRRTGKQLVDAELLPQRDLEEGWRLPRNLFGIDDRGRQHDGTLRDHVTLLRTRSLLGRIRGWFSVPGAPTSAYPEVIPASGPGVVSGVGIWRRSVS